MNGACNSISGITERFMRVRTKVAATKSRKVAATKSRKIAATKSSKTNLHTKNSQAATMPQLAAAAKPHACCLFATNGF